MPHCCQYSMWGIPLKRSPHMSKAGCLLLAFVVAAVAVYGFIATSSEGKALLKASQAQSATLFNAQPNDTTFAVQDPPSIDASFINTVLCTASPTDTPIVSPACGTGQALYDLGVKYGIDPAYALA